MAPAAKKCDLAVSAGQDIVGFDVDATNNGDGYALDPATKWVGPGGVLARPDSSRCRSRHPSGTHAGGAANAPAVQKLPTARSCAGCPDRRKISGGRPRGGAQGTSGGHATRAWGSP